MIKERRYKKFTPPPVIERPDGLTDEEFLKGLLPSRDISIRIRLSAEQKKRLEDMAYDARKNVSEYVRDVLGLEERKS